MSSDTYFTIEPAEMGGYEVYEHSEYEASSVLAGRPKRSYLKHFDSLDAAIEAYPQADVRGGSSRIEGYNARDLMPTEPPDWFDPLDAGEAWGEDDY